MDNNYILETKDLTKRFDDTLAIDHLDLQIEKGKVYGLIGRNGAGKTTFLKLISNMLFPTNGQVELNSEYISKSGDIAFGKVYNTKYFNMKIKNILSVAADCYPNWKQEYADELVEAFELDIKKNYMKSSAGMQTMVGLIISMAADPELLLLDEPYVGLDPINRELFYKFLRNHYFDGEKTVIISSHMIREIEGYFEKAIIIQKGKLLLNEDIDSLKARSFIIQVEADAGKWIEQNLKVLDKEELAGRYTYYVFDQMNTNTQGKIISLDGEIQGMDLQTLMVKLLGKGGKK